MATLKRKQSRRQTQGPGREGLLVPWTGRFPVAILKKMRSLAVAHERSLIGEICVAINQYLSQFKSAPRRCKMHPNAVLLSRTTVTCGHCLTIIQDVSVSEDGHLSGATQIDYGMVALD